MFLLKRYIEPILKSSMFLNYVSFIIRHFLPKSQLHSSLIHKAKRRKNTCTERYQKSIHAAMTEVLCKPSISGEHEKPLGCAVGLKIEALVFKRLQFQNSEV